VNYDDMEEYRIKQSEISAMLFDQEEEQSLFISDRQRLYGPSDAPLFQIGLSEYTP